MVEDHTDEEGRRRIKAFWERVEDLLKRHYWHCSLVNLCGLRYREGWYLLLAGSGLLALNKATATWPGRWTWFSVLAAAWYILDSLFVNTWITIITRSPINPLRSIVLTLANIANIGSAFAILYAAQERAGFVEALTAIQALYFSFVTMMTIGYGDIVPRSDTVRMLVVAQVFVGLYFLAAIVSTVVQWAQNSGNKGTAR